jgi:hypothetical protein
MVDGLATMVTVATGFVTGVTVTVAVAAAVPCVPVAVAVYMVVTAGVTTLDPPLACKVNTLPSLPATATSVALVALTVSVEDAPAAIVNGLAAMLTATAGFEVAEMPPPHPEAPSSNARLDSSTAPDRRRERVRGVCCLPEVFAFAFNARDARRKDPRRSMAALVDGSLLQATVNRFSKQDIWISLERWA